MTSFDDFIRINRLLDLYGSLLTNAQAETMTDYFAYNLSLSEIAANRHSSRTAVSDALKKGTAKLDYFEDKLHLLAHHEQLDKLLAQSNLPGLDAETIEAIRRIINHGV